MKRDHYLDPIVRHQAESLDALVDRVAALEKRLGTPPDVTLEEEIRTLKRHVSEVAVEVEMRCDYPSNR